ncbi:unnamed protein product, partial [Sphenostylis stenocarpa]
MESIKIVQRTETSNEWEDGWCATHTWQEPPMRVGYTDYTRDITRTFYASFKGVHTFLRASFCTKIHISVNINTY